MFIKEQYRFKPEFPQIAGLEGAGIIDSVGGKTGTELLKSVAVNARIVVYGILSWETAEFHNSVFLYKNVVMKGFGIRGYLESRTREQKDRIFASLATTLVRKEFTLEVSAWYSFGEYRKALEAYHTTTRRGKIVIRPE